MADGPYSPGWPKRMAHVEGPNGEVAAEESVVLLSDAERMREALEPFARLLPAYMGDEGTRYVFTGPAAAELSRFIAAAGAALDGEES